MTARQRWAASAVGSVLLAVALGACGSSPDAPAAQDAGPGATLANDSGAATSPPRQPVATVDPAPGSGSPRVPGPGVAALSAVPPGLEPARISIPSIGVDALMTDLGIAADGAVEVPGDPSQVGWVETTSAPGQQGPAVVAGHVDSTTGPAVFYELGTLETGDAITVARRDGTTASFTVDGVRTYPQDRFPTRDVYGPVPGPALRLITCGGAYDPARGGYQDNVVVYAS